MIKQLLYALIAVVALAACNDDEDLNAYNSYSNWQERNEQWFAQLAAQAREGMAKGEDWAMYCSTSLNQGTSLSDSVIVRYVKRGSGDAPCFNDTVRINYRGWLMPATYRIDGNDVTYSMVFDQSFYGDYAADALTPFDDGTAATVKSSVSAYIAGFATALQHMQPGDQAHIYIPHQLGYGENGSGQTIPAYSTLHFFVQLKSVKPAGS